MGLFILRRLGRDDTDGALPDVHRLLSDEPLSEP